MMGDGLNFSFHLIGMAGNELMCEVVVADAVKFPDAGIGGALGANL